MKTLLIDQFVSAVKSWTSMGRNADDITFFVGLFVGFSYYADKEKTENLRDSLIRVVRGTGISQTLLVCGLIKVIETRLRDLASGREKSRAKIRAIIDDAQRSLDGDPTLPEPIADVFRYKSPDEVRGFIRRMTEMMNNPNDNEAERRLMLLDWMELTGPIIEQENLMTGMSEDVDNLEGGL